jgi:hypothetical protein
LGNKRQDLPAILKVAGPPSRDVKSSNTDDPSDNAQLYPRILFRKLVSFKRDANTSGGSRHLGKTTAPWEQQCNTSVLKKSAEQCWQTTFMGPA